MAAPREAITLAEGVWRVPPDSVRPDGLAARTDLRRLWTGSACTLVAADPYSGRRHQIRVHLAWIGHPIAGDPLFGPAAAGERTCLHAWRLAFDDADGRRVEVTAHPGEDFWAPVAAEITPAERAGLLLSSSSP